MGRPKKQSQQEYQEPEVMTEAWFMTLPTNLVPMHLRQYDVVFIRIFGKGGEVTGPKPLVAHVISSDESSTHVVIPQPHVFLDRLEYEFDQIVPIAAFDLYLPLPEGTGYKSSTKELPLREVEAYVSRFSVLEIRELPKLPPLTFHSIGAKPL